MEITKKQANWLYNQITQENGKHVFLNGAGNIVIEYADNDKTESMGFMPYFFDGTSIQPCKLQKENYKIAFLARETDIIRSRSLRPDNNTAAEVETIKETLQNLLIAIRKDNENVRNYLK